MNKYLYIDGLIVAFYFLLTVGAECFSCKFKVTSKDYFGAKNIVPWWVASVSVFATFLSPITFLALAGNSYNGSWILYFAQLGPLVALPAVLYWFIPVYHKLNLTTVYEYLEIRFKSRFLRIVGALVFVLYQLGRSVFVLYFPSMILSQYLGVSTAVLILIGGGITLFYSCRGGIKRIIWMDFFQGGILIFAIAVSLVIVCSQIDGGMGQIMHSLVYEQKFLASTDRWFDINLLNDSVFLLITGSAVTNMGNIVAAQDMLQRIRIVDKIKNLKKCFLQNALLSVVIGAAFYFIGTGIYILYKQGNILTPIDNDRVYISYIMNYFPAGIRGLVLLGVYAALQSTISSSLSAISSSVMEDIFFVSSSNVQTNKIKIGRIICGVTGGLIIAGALFFTKAGVHSIYISFNAFMGLMFGILTSMFVLGVFAPKTNKAGIIGSLIAQGIVMFFLVFYTHASIWSYSIICTATALLVGPGVSRLYEVYKSK